MSLTPSEFMASMAAYALAKNGALELSIDIAHINDRPPEQAEAAASVKWEISVGGSCEQDMSTGKEVCKGEIKGTLSGGGGSK